jgi:hypothetical protein
MKLRELFELALGGAATVKPGTATPTPGARVQPSPPGTAGIQQLAAGILAGKSPGQPTPGQTTPEQKAAAEEIKKAAKGMKDAAVELDKAVTNPVGEDTQLTEYSVDFVDNLVTLLRNLIGRADEKEMSSKMSYRALKRMLQKTVGSSVSLDKEIFQELTNSNQQLSKYVTKIGNHGVVLATEVKYKPKTKPTPVDKTPKTPKTKKSSVERAASSGAKYLSKSRNNP